MKNEKRTKKKETKGGAAARKHRTREWRRNFWAKAKGRRTEQKGKELRTGLSGEEPPPHLVGVHRHRQIFAKKIYAVRDPFSLKFISLFKFIS
mgnify:CR=1 FL=1